jgi:hypothetical protein
MVSGFGVLGLSGISVVSLIWINLFVSAFHPREVRPVRCRP